LRVAFADSDRCLGDSDCCLDGVDLRFEGSCFDLQGSDFGLDYGRVLNHFETRGRFDLELADWSRFGLEGTDFRLYFGRLQTDFGPTDDYDFDLGYCYFYPDGKDFDLEDFYSSPDWRDFGLVAVDSGLDYYALLERVVDDIGQRGMGLAHEEQGVVLVEADFASAVAAGIDFEHEVRDVDL